VGTTAAPTTHFLCTQAMLYVAPVETNICRQQEYVIFADDVVDIPVNAFHSAPPAPPKEDDYYPSPAYYPLALVKSVIIPDTVMSIGVNAFGFCSLLTTVSIGNNVTSIGQGAFYASAITSVVIPDSATTIGDYAFAYCGSLSSVTIGSKVAQIGNHAFHSAKMTTLVIPDSVTTIGTNAFENCGSLSSLTMGSGVTTIGRSAFQSTAITSVVIPDGVTVLNAAVFRYCSSLSEVTIGSGVTFLDAWAFQSTAIQFIDIPESVTMIGFETFSSTALIFVSIPDSVTNILTGAFRNCRSLVSVGFGAGLKVIADYAFADTALTTVSVPSGARYWSIAFPPGISITLY
jgi:BspA type Leucine rich repeat region (6 copies)